MRRIADAHIQLSARCVLLVGCSLLTGSLAPLLWQARLKANGWLGGRRRRAARCTPPAGPTEGRHAECTCGCDRRWCRSSPSSRWAGLLATGARARLSLPEGSRTSRQAGDTEPPTCQRIEGAALPRARLCLCRVPPGHFALLLRVRRPAAASRISSVRLLRARRTGGSLRSGMREEHRSGHLESWITAGYRCHRSPAFESRLRPTASAISNGCQRGRPSTSTRSAGSFALRADVPCSTSDARL